MRRIVLSETWEQFSLHESSSLANRVANGRVGAFLLVHFFDLPLLHVSEGVDWFGSLAHVWSCEVVIHGISPNLHIGPSQEPFGRMFWVCRSKSAESQMRVLIDGHVLTLVIQETDYVSKYQGQKKKVHRVWEQAMSFSSRSKTTVRLSERSITLSARCART